MLNRIIIAIRQMWWRRKYAHWDDATLRAEVESFGQRINLSSRMEYDAQLLLGLPSSTQEESLQYLDDSGNVTFQADYGLVYDNLLPHTRIVLHISKGFVHRVTFMPKLRRCPPSMRDVAGSYYAPD